MVVETMVTLETVMRLITIVTMMNVIVNHLSPMAIHEVSAMTMK